MVILQLSFVKGKQIQRGFIDRLVDRGMETVIIAWARVYPLKSCIYAASVIQFSGQQDLGVVHLEGFMHASTLILQGLFELCLESSSVCKCPCDH